MHSYTIHLRGGYNTGICNTNGLLLVTYLHICGNNVDAIKWVRPF